MSCCHCEPERIILHKRVIPRALVFSKENNGINADIGQDIIDREVEAGREFIKYYYPMLANHAGYEETSMDHDHWDDLLIKFFIEVL